MTHAGERMRWILRILLTRGWLTEWKNVPRPGYCHCCRSWTWLTNEVPAYSARDGAYLCEECKDENDKETAQAWADYYGGCL